MSEQSSVNRGRRQVLPEEKFQANLQQVVQRQYFPELPLLSQTAALYERRAAGDVAGAVAIRRAMRQRQDAEEAEQQVLAATGATAAESGVTTGQSSQLTTTVTTPTTTIPVRPLHQSSLTEFHARVTSEDNADFATQQSQDVEASRKRQRLEYSSWARINSSRPSGEDDTAVAAVRALPPSNTYVASPLPLASDQFNPSPYRKSIQQYAQEAEQAPIQNNLLFLPAAGQYERGKNTTTTLALLDGTAGRNDTKQNGTTLTTTAATTNMPPPSMNPSQTSTTRIISSIEPAATRFPSSAIAITGAVQRTLATYRHHPATANTSGPTPGLNLEESEGEASTIGRHWDYLSSTDASTDLDAPPRFNLQTERMLGQRRKEQEWDTMVQMTPLIVPGGQLPPDSSASDVTTSSSSGGVVDEPIMTWGEVADTPLVLGGHGGDGDQQPDGYNHAMDNDEEQTPAFGVTQSARDRAAEKARQRMEERSRLASATRQPSFRRSQPTTTVGRRRTPSIAARRAGSLSARSASSFGTALRSAYSATPESRKRSTTSSCISRNDGLHRGTPRVRPGRGDSSSNNESNTGTTAAKSSSKHVTRGLLQL